VDDESIEVLKQRVAQAVVQANAKPDREYRLAFSLGVARFDPNSPVPIETLINEADARMYEAKQRRRPSGRADARASVA
jgi:PleD family two-component response regulator